MVNKFSFATFFVIFWSLLLVGCTADGPLRELEIGSAASPVVTATVTPRPTVEPTATISTATPSPVVAPPSPSPSPTSEAYMEHYEQGLALLQEQGISRELDLEQAVDALSQAIEINPQFPDAYTARADALLELGELDGALSDAHNALELNPEDDVAYDIAGFAALLQEDFVEAVTYFDQAISFNPEAARTYFHRGQAHYFLSDRRAALADYHQAIELDPQSPEFWFSASLVNGQLGQIRQALAEIEQAISLDDQDARFHFQHGFLLRSEEDLQGALAAYDRAIARDPKLANAYHNRGNVFRDLGQPDQAEADYDQAILLDEQHGLTFLNRGLIRFGRRDYEAALADFDQAVALEPQMGRAYQQRGLGRLAAGDAQGAYDDFSQANSLDSSDSGSLANQARSLALLGRHEQSLDALKAQRENEPQNLHLLTLVGFTFLEMDDPDSALIQFDLLLEQLEESREVGSEEDGRLRSAFVSADPHEAALARLGRGRANMAAGAIEEGMADFRQAMRYDEIALLPEIDSVLNNGREEIALFLLRGLLLARQGRWETARADYQKAVDLGADGDLLSRFLLERGDTAAAQGDVNGAIADLEEAIRLSPNQAGMYILLGRLYFENGDMEQAIGNFDVALVDLPDHSDALAYRGAAEGQLGNLENAQTDLCRSWQLLQEEGADGGVVGFSEIESFLEQLELENCEL